jgi:hypothetical protein
MGSSDSERMFAFEDLLVWQKAIDFAEVVKKTSMSSIPQESITESLNSSSQLQLACRRILPRERDDFRKKNSFTICISPGDLSSKQLVS